MGRIRSIKPDFSQSESIGNLSRDARLLFILLWTDVDDEGRARASSRRLASNLYPYDRGDNDPLPHLEFWLAELEREGCIRRYIVDGAQYLEISNWLKHQKIDHPSKSKLPEPPRLLAKPRENSRSLAPDMEVDMDKDMEVDMDSARSEKKRATTPPKEISLTNKTFALEKGWPESRVKSEYSRFHDYCLSNGKTYKNVDAAWRNWVTSPYQATGNGNGRHVEKTNGRTHSALDALDDIFGTTGTAEPSKAATGVASNSYGTDYLRLPKG